MEENKNIYKEIKNVIHNDLGITKEYVDNVIKETVKNEISKLMNDDCFIRGLVEKEVMYGLRRKDESAWHTIHDASNFIKEEINSTILQMVKDKLEIRLKGDD